MERLDNYNLRINEIIDRYALFMLRNPNIVGVGRGNKIINGCMTNQPTLTFFVINKLASNSLNKSDIIPKFIRGVMTDVFESGPTVALRPKAQRISINEDIASNKDRHIFSSGLLPEDKTAFGGGCLYMFYQERYVISATLTYAVTDVATRKKVYFLTSRNFLDTDNNFKAGGKVHYSRRPKSFSSLKDMILNTKYLGKAEKVSKYNKIPTEKNAIEQSVDAGMGYIGEDNDDTRSIILPGLTNGKIIVKTEMPAKGEICYQVGMETNYVEGRIITTNTKQRASNGDVTNIGKEYTIYKDQIAMEHTKGSSSGGDVGALGVVQKTNRAFGMNNACSPKVSYYSYIKDVFDDLGVDFLI